MENTVNSVAANASSKIVGFICSDTQGNCISRDGVADEKFSGAMVQLLAAAEEIDESRKDNLVLGLNFDKYKVYVKNSGNITTGVYLKH